MSGCPIGPILGSLGLALGGGKGGEGLDPDRNPVGVSILFCVMPLALSRWCCLVTVYEGDGGGIATLGSRAMGNYAYSSVIWWSTSK